MIVQSPALTGAESRAEPLVLARVNKRGPTEGAAVSTIAGCSQSGTAGREDESRLYLPTTHTSLYYVLYNSLFSILYIYMIRLINSLKFKSAALVLMLFPKVHVFQHCLRKNLHLWYSFNYFAEEIIGKPIDKEHLVVR